MKSLTLCRCGGLHEPSDCPEDEKNKDPMGFFYRQFRKWAREAKSQDVAAAYDRCAYELEKEIYG